MIKQPDITAPMTDNLTAYTCPDCGKHWISNQAIAGLLHSTKLCSKCERKSKNVKH